jgi:hypothetical protein
MTLNELLGHQRDIWGPTPTPPDTMLIILTTVLGDIARLIRDGNAWTPELGVELANLLSTATRFLDDLSIEPDTATHAALHRQRQFVQRHQNQLSL